MGLTRMLSFMIIFGLSGLMSLSLLLGSGFVVSKMILLIKFTLTPFSGVPVEWPFFIDSSSIVFSMTVSLITIAVFLFSSNYMASEPEYVRFHGLLLLFVASMLLLIYSPSLISVLLGWDGLGVTSYLLVIYFQSHKSLNAGTLTALSNRIGDCLILLSIAAGVHQVSWSSPAASFISKDSVSLFLGLLLMVAAFTKSAQLPFSAWLPAAMAAPTPVSSLVHSSTLVTAGVYLLYRYTPVMESVGLARGILPFGVATMLLAGMSALFETDMKKIVALSTLSQLGLMMCAIGLNISQIAFFHLITHAYFKALLFMAVGNMIHLSDSYQDFRKSPQFSRGLSQTLTFAMAANMSLMGLPYMAGFYSKDLIMEAGLTTTVGSLIPELLFFSTALTAAYTSRSVIMILSSHSRSSPLSWQEDFTLDLPTANFILLSLAVIGGALSAWIMPTLLPVQVLMSQMKNITLSMIILGVFGGVLYFNFSFALKSFLYSWSWGTLWATPLSSGALSSASGLKLSETLRFLDISWLWKTSIITPSEFHPISSFGMIITSKSVMLELSMVGALALFLFVG